MINPISRSLEWMHQMAAKNNFKDITLIEKIKAAYLSVLMANNIPEVRHFNSNNIEPLRNAIIEAPMHTKLNKLKRTNIEAFYYWYEISLLRHKE